MHLALTRSCFLFSCAAAVCNKLPNNMDLKGNQGSGVEDASQRESGEDEEGSGDSDSQKGAVDLVIQSAAQKANLSVLNVKSILHHVLKDKRVLAVIQRRAAEEDGEGPAPPLDDDIIIEPRLTRSRVREAVASTMSPDKIARMRAITHSPTRTGSLSAEELLNQSLGTDESSDEEYVPEGEGAELSDQDSEGEDLPSLHDNDRDSTLSPMSCDNNDVTTPPPGEATPTEQSTESIEKEAATLLASLSDVILSPIKTRGQSAEEVSTEPVKEGEIAHRTRSKFPLTDTPLSDIENSFQPPDAEDPPTPLELDEEDREWRQWLNDLMNPPESVTGDEGEDTEYNYLAEQDVIEKEEWRNDRAVKIPRREVDELLNELLYPSSDGLSGLVTGEGVDPTSAYLLEALGLQTPLVPQALPTDETTSTTGDEAVGCYLSLDQAKQLSEQVRQHYQLLMQTFVLCRFEPSLLFLSQVAVQALDELTTWSREAEQGLNSAVWYNPHAREGAELVTRLDPNNRQAVTTTTNSGTRPPEGAQEVFMTTPLFWDYPTLLPAVPFAPVGEGQGTGFSCFSSAEDCLLVMGMDHYGPVAWQQIKANLLPTKTTKQLQLRVKNQNSKRTGANVVKHYKKTKELKIPFNEEKPRDLPQWVMQYYKKQADKEKEAKKMKEELTKETAKLKKMLNLINQPLSQQPSPWLQPKYAPEGGSKRNLMSTLEEATNNDKRPRVDVVTISKEDRVSSPQARRPHPLPPQAQKPHSSSLQGVRGRGLHPVEPVRRRMRGRKAKSNRRSGHEVPCQQTLDAPPPSTPNKATPTSPYSGRLEHLLLAAGLKPSDYSARFAYSYMNEVKRTLPPDGVKFSQFLDVLVRADENNWKPARVYEEVRGVLGAWPHLVTLFTELLSEEDCVEADAVSTHTHTHTHTRTCTHTQMRERLEVTSIRKFALELKEQFKNSPLSLAAILDQLAALDSPTLTADEVERALLPLVTAHEELVLALRSFLYQLPPRQSGGWEELHLSTPPSECETISQAQLLAAVNRTPPTSRTPPTNRTPPTSSTGAVCTPPSVDCEATTSQVSPSCHSWSRQEDGMILKQCLQQSSQPMEEVFAQVGATLSHTPHEVECRYNELVGLLNSVRTKHSPHPSTHSTH